MKVIEYPFLENELDARTGMFKDFTDEQVDITRRGLKEQKATIQELIRGRKISIFTI